MKTKNKMIAMLEIAIVLCSMLLVAIPAIAAQEQNQEMQKVSASTITTTSEDDYVLGVYGNANEDDTIDMRDLTYVKLIFFGKKPETELADAKYDGKVNPLDFIQIKLIIVGKEKEITVVDSADRIMTVKQPIERIALMAFYSATLMQILGEVEDERILCVHSWVKRYEKTFPTLSKLPVVDSKDYEAILSLNPDLVVITPRYAIETAEKLPGIPVVAASLTRAPAHVQTRTEVPEEIMMLGYLMDKEEEAKCFNDFADKYLDLIKSRTEGLSEEEKPKVYEEAYKRPYHVFPGMIEEAGGSDIFSDLIGGVDVDPEEVIVKNPDVIIKKMSRKDSGYETKDLSKAKEIRDEVMSRPELANVNAVKNGRCYAIAGGITYGPEYSLAVLYYAKCMYPELFEDLDSQAIHQEYIDRFKRIDFNVKEDGVFVYPPLE